MSRSDDAWYRRVLCSDGNCIGVIGPDGRCKECGKPYEGDLPLAECETAAEDADLAEAAEEPPVAASGEPLDGDAEAGADDDADDWEKRTLCSDESCIGVVGPDGRCKECGKPYSE